MTDQDNLRDRIADQIMPASVREIDKAAGRAALAVAGKIIDEFGLTVEASMFGGRIDEGAPYKAARVVGKWEKQ